MEFELTPLHPNPPRGLRTPNSLVSGIIGRVISNICLFYLSSFRRVYELKTRNTVLRDVAEVLNDVLLNA